MLYLGTFKNGYIEKKKIILLLLEENQEYSYISYH